MKRLLLLLITFAPMPAPAQQTLATLVDRNRVLLLFAPSFADGRYGQQIDALAHHSTELRTRDLVVIPLLLQPTPPIAANTLATIQPLTVSDDEQLTLRRRFHIAQSDFAVILLGKDGGEKLRTRTPISLQRLTRTIDAMPMRKQEMANPH